MNLSLYLHIPFCARKCRYCDFYSVPYDEPRADEYLAALAKEISLYDNDPEIHTATLHTVYIGGGTPSILSVGQLRELCGLVRNSFAFANNLEWTVECNPDSFTREKASVFLENGVTRLSFGMQSMNDKELALLGRVHSSTRCKEILYDPMLAEFASIGIDLMYGLPGQTIGSLAESLDMIFAAPRVSHISAYELTIASQTPFGRHRSLLPLPGRERMEAMTETLWNTLEVNGFEQYEVSNFARVGHKCRHNGAYWDHGPYLGLGCAAHSFIESKRWGNMKDISGYCSMVKDGSFPRDFHELIDTKCMAFEMLFLGLRRVKGIDENDFRKRCGVEFVDYVNCEKLDLFEKQGLLAYKKPFWVPTKRGLLMADGMARELVI
jgi:oxygen-independent coproporphyrinogen III oxidase